MSVALAVVGGAAAWALSGLPGAPAACLPDGCDCEAVGPGPIRQPANAWSSLALAVAGAASLASPHRWGLTGLAAGGALVAAGVAAFLAHAGLTAWAARLDGIGVAVLVGALAVWRWWSQFLPPPPPGGGGAPGAARRGARFCLSRRKPVEARPAPAGRGGGKDAPEANRTPALLLAPSRRAGRGQVTWLAWLLLALAGLFWLLGRTGGPWCRPDALLQAHAAWHLLAAAAIFLWLHNRRPRGRLPSGWKRVHGCSRPER